MAFPITTPASSATLAPSTSAAAGEVASVPVAVTSTPTNIDQLLRQITINGTLTTQPDNATVTLATALGNFSFSFAQLPDATKQQLVSQLLNLFQVQKPVTAIVQPGAPPTQAVLMLPGTSGNIPATAATATAQTPTPQALTLLAGDTLRAVVLPPGIVLPGTSPLPNTSTQQLAPTPSPQLQAQNSAQASAPSQGEASSASLAMPQPSMKADAPSGPTFAQAGQLPAANNLAQTASPIAAQNIGQGSASAVPPSPSAIPASTTNSLLQSGKEIALRIDAIAPPNAPPLTPNVPNQISATVIGNGAGGQLLVKAGDATLFVRTNVEAPAGTNVLMTIETQKTAAPAVIPPLPQQDFPELQQVIQALVQIDPQLAQQMVDTHLPQPAAQLATPLLFFLSALKQGDIKGWLGRDVGEAMAKGNKAELFTKLVRTLNASVQTAQDPVVGEWKSYPVPLLNNGQLQALTLHVHADGGGKSTGGDEAKTPNQVRFLIDVCMSRLGTMQLDGLVRPKKLDMIVRSESALPPGLPQDLRNGYISTIEALGFTGSLSFQIGKQHWLTPRQETPKSVTL